MYCVYTELAGAVFAAVVPNSADKPLQEVIEEIMGDHEMMVSQLLFIPFYHFYTFVVCLLVVLIHLLYDAEIKRIKLEISRYIGT